jgi:hypothetical protein
MFPLTEDSVSRLKYEHGKHVRDMDRVERLSVPEDRQPILVPNRPAAHEPVATALLRISTTAFVHWDL